MVTVSCFPVSLRWTVVKPHLRTNLLDEGVIDKNGWLAFLDDLETKSG